MAYDRSGKKAIKAAYSGKTEPELNRIQLPQTIPCNGCHKRKNLAAFSDKQKYELKRQIKDNPRFDATRAEFICCSSCTPSQRVEFQCTDCDEWKSRDKFSKAQLKDPDKAVSVVFLLLPSCFTRYGQLHGI
ncbi:hypothetical protein BAUCODRAFT_34172 [Baudoinia panamericana UAMH 10762]|uniref:Stc1 domain-containing protein n=1 Tax=Baudoinia panamericana (strain UAMH 10762) TaxID=717646 RepID=M2LQR9_BAUPA|nr:uncharacterized protein BAUCODRAFT_34172 [Baudoinia panamericana UAMH 10762]EMC96777.1 hypothetical protein BAUCODRAFT_34172 [Baudoinia panamericana UAMH 10762]